MVHAVSLRMHFSFQAWKGFAAFTQAEHPEFIVHEKDAFPPVIHDRLLEIELLDQRVAVLKASFTGSCIQQIRAEHC